MSHVNNAVVAILRLKVKRCSCCRWCCACSTLESAVAWMLYQSANCEDDDDDQFPFLVLHTQYDHELWVVTRSQDKHMILCPRPKMILSE